MSYLYWFAVVTVLTYAMTGSALFVPIRRFLGVRSWFLLDLIHCPICFGFWVALAAAYYYPEPSLWRFVHAPALFVGGLLAVRLLAPRWLVSDNYENELEIIADHIDHRHRTTIRPPAPEKEDPS